MAEVIKLVHGDTLPLLRLTLTDSVANAAVNLTGASVFLHVRPVNSTVLAFTNTAVVTNAVAGICTVTWTNTDLVRAAGSYDAEVEIVFSNGSRETIYDLVSLYIRDEIGPTSSGSLLS